MKSIIYLLIFPALLCACDPPSSQTNESNKPPEPKYVKLGEPLRTEYFEVTVRGIGLFKQFIDEDKFIELKEEPNTMYLIIKVNFKNTDTESRTIMDGAIHVKYNGKDYLFDQSETILAEGWGLFFDAINPLTSKTTNLVYKLPSEINGELFYQPGRSDDDQLIRLGTPAEISNIQNRSKK